MTDALTNALWITLIGMGLVFIAILLLWGLMALIVRVFAEREPAEEQAGEAAAVDSAEAETVAADTAPEPAAADSDRKRRAAAAAVAVALAMQRAVPQPRSAAPEGGLSAWQTVHRAGQISQRVNSSRKKVVR